ncbi:MAG: glycoside hydrolase family 5 protein [Lachnospiraceae bacterium]|nr:glycoside hydrolase family 5 protein [Lachnospiraceae bacterium]
MKKRVALALAAILTLNLITLSGCGAGGASEVTSAEPAVAQDDAASDDASSEAAVETADDNDAGAETEEVSAETGDTDEDAETASDEEADAEGGNADGFKLSDGIVMPEVNAPALNLPDNEGVNFVKNLGVGFNLGNTFDAYCDPTPADEMETETYWHHTYTTQDMIKDIHAYGFDTIRIPVSWHNHVDADVTISEQWLDRVNEVVDWAIDDGMYVILDIHHDNHPEANGFYPDRAHEAQSKKYISRIWEQVAERFADYDEHLIFEGMNEPRLVDTEHEWDLKPGEAECHEAIDCINELNQLFVDTVRAAGGNNGTRYLMVPGYAASMDGGTNPFFEMPTDIDGNDSRIILSIHAYTPYNFALEYPGVSDFDIDNKGRTTDINTFMNKLYMDYVSQGTPVIIGEFGSRDKNGNLQDRVNFTAYFTAYARARGIPCILWDNNEFTGSGELFGVYNRKNPENSKTDIIAAMMQYK